MKIDILDFSKNFVAGIIGVSVFFVAAMLLLVIAIAPIEIFLSMLGLFLFIIITYYVGKKIVVPLCDKYFGGFL